MTRRRCRPLIFVLCAFVLPLLWASAAQAISIIKVKEIYAGANEDSYVGLEAYSSYYYAGDTLPGKSLILFDAAGQPTQRFTFSEKNNLGTENLKVLVGGPNVQSTFGIKPDLIDPAMVIDPSGGAVCWNVGDTPVDCAAWGDFTGQAALEAYAGSPVGNPALPTGIPAGMALRRTIAPNCPTWLDGEDDTNDSATDFFEATPYPQNEEFIDPAEYECVSGMPDDTRFVEKPSDPSRDRNPHFGYTATGATSYQCKLDSAPVYSACSPSGVDYSGLADGSHTILVRALNGAGPDASPAQYTWTVDTTAPVTTFLAHPGATSYGRSAQFEFGTDESGSTFRCSLDSAPPSSCRSPIELTSLSGGSHTFSVAAVDPAGNVQSPPTSYTWTADTQPPVTTIDSRPSNPTSSSSVIFTYHANRPDAVFECSMDGAQFSSCPSSGANYSELAKGSHTFAVRAVDSDNEAEASPPSYTFTVGPPPPSRTCRKGYRKKTVRGVARCVKIRHRKHHRHL
jgi:hypothetical protein